MNHIRVSVTADGITREFVADGDGPVIVAAFRAWLAGPDGELSMASGADAIDEASARLSADADDLDEMDGPSVKRWLIERVAKDGEVNDEAIFNELQVLGVPRARFMAALRDLLDDGKVFARRNADTSITLSKEPVKP